VGLVLAGAILSAPPSSPGGARSAFDRPSFLLEALPEQRASAALPDDVAFR